MPRVTLDGIAIHDGDTVQLMGNLTIDTLGQSVALFVDGEKWIPVSDEDGTLQFIVAQGGLFDIRVNGYPTVRFTNTFNPADFRVDSWTPDYFPQSTAQRDESIEIIGANLDKYGPELDYLFSNRNDTPFAGGGWVWHYLGDAEDVEVEEGRIAFTAKVKNKCYLSALRISDTQEVIWTNNTRPLPE